MTAQERIAKRKQILHVYEHIQTQERENQMQLTQQEIMDKYQEESEDFKADKKNIGFNQMKVRLRKSLQELEQQANTIKMIEEIIAKEMVQETTLIKE